MFFLIENVCGYGCTQEIVPLRKVCRRPETEYRLSGKPLSEMSSLPVVDVKSVPATTTTPLIEKPVAVEP